MKICIFCHDSYMSGANMSLYDWISNDKEDEFILILPHYTENQYFESLSNCKIISGNYFCVVDHLDEISILSKLKKNIKLIYMTLFKRYIIKRLEKIIGQTNPEAIITNSFSNLLGAEVSRILKIPHFWHVREFMELDHKITHRNVELVNDLVKNSYAIFISDVIKNYYLNKYNFKDSIVIYDQIKLDKNFNIEKKFFIDDKIRIIMSGTLQENKGQKEAIQAVTQLLEDGYDVKLDIYGEGPQKNELKNIIQKTGYENNIFLKGYISNLENIRSTYDIALVCSSNEALGRVTIESMGSGCITIGANAGCTKDLIVDSLNGYLYELNNIDDLCNKIKFVYINKDKASELSLRARKYAVNNFGRPIYPKILNYINKNI